MRVGRNGSSNSSNANTDEWNRKLKCECCGKNAARYFYVKCIGMEMFENWYPIDFFVLPACSLACAKEAWMGTAYSKLDAEITPGEKI